MHIAILGRQYAFGLAELESLYGAEAVTPVGQIAALIDSDTIDIQSLGGSPKAGRVVAELTGDWRRVAQSIERHYAEAWRNVDHKVTLGISAYERTAPSPRELQRLGLALKKSRKNHPGSLRLIPNDDSALSTATSHHNKLGLSPHKIELLIVQAPNGITYLAESTGAQNITALAARDQARPKTDAFVGMLPPKLAKMMLNFTGGTSPSEPPRSRSALGSPPPKARLTPHAQAAEGEQNDTSQRSPEPEPRDGRTLHPATVLDPFCGTGVLLQEALLMGYDAYGTDLSEKMIDYSTINLQWLTNKYDFITSSYRLELGDAMKHQWTPPIDAVVCETYLGQPFSAPPSPAKLRDVRDNCNHIISTFLRNIHGQIAAGTQLTIAVPAWRDTNGRFTHLPLTRQLSELGYRRRQLLHVRPDQLIYYRESQVVAREILLLEKP